MTENNQKTRTYVRFATLGLISLAAVVLMGAACSVRLKTKQATAGVYKTDNRGKTWTQAVFVAQTEKQTITIAGLSVHNLMFSPLDQHTLYALTESGVYETQNSGEVWRKILDANASALALHPKIHDTAYATVGNQIIKTINGGEGWQIVYVDITPQARFTTLALDPDKPEIIYAGNDVGNVLRSADGGVTWQQRFAFTRQTLNQLVLDPRTPTTLYAAQAQGSVWRSDDSAQTWREVTTTLRRDLKVNQGAMRKLVLLPSRADALLLATAYGLFRSTNGGETWELIPLVTSPNIANIRALTPDPRREDVIWYVGDSTLYQTTNGGETWQTLLLPSANPVQSLLINSTEPNIMYLGLGR